MSVSTLGLYGAPVMEGNGSFAGKSAVAPGAPNSALRTSISIGLCVLLALFLS